MIESKLKAKNCNRGQLFRPCWVSSGHDILDFSYCPLSRVLHVTLPNGPRLCAFLNKGIFDTRLNSDNSYYHMIPIQRIKIATRMMFRI